MPSNLLQADVGFPEFKEGQKPDEKINQVVNYLYMLLEQLRYSFGNLDADNFSESGITELEHLITEPVYAYITNVEEGLSTALNVTAQGLTTRITNEIAGVNQTITATAEALTAQIGTVDGKYTALSLSVAGLNTQINDPDEGAFAQITANANAITQRVTSDQAEAMISTFAQSIQLLVVNGSDSSTITLSGNGISAQATGTISFTGMVRFSSFNVPAYNSSTYYYVGDQVTYGGYIYTCIKAGRGYRPDLNSTYWTQSASTTFINGGHIQTGTITADLVGAGTLASTSSSNLINLKGYLGVVNSSGTPIGYLGSYNTSDLQVFGLYYNGLQGGAVTVKQDSANMGVGYCGVSTIRSSNTNQYVSLGLYDGTQGTLIFRRTAIEPGANGVMSLGTTSYGWSAAYFKCGASMGAVLGAAGSGQDNGRYIWLGGTTYGSGCGFAVDLYNQRLILTNGSAWRKFDFSTNTWGSL